MWDLIVSVPDHCLSFYFSKLAFGEIRRRLYGRDFVSRRRKTPYLEKQLSIGTCASRTLKFHTCSVPKTKKW